MSHILEWRAPNAVVVSDEVYDFLTFDGKPHKVFASLADNWRKTITVYSSGKLLSSHSWKSGYAIAPERLLRPMRQF